MVRNMILLEATEAHAPSLKTSDVTSLIKKSMNVCKLAKFKSDSSNMQLYSMFFLSTLPDLLPNVQQWTDIYTELLSSNVFCEDLSKFMALYRPSSFTGIFAPLWNMIQLELAEMKKDRVRYLSLTKASIGILANRMAGVGQLVRNQVNDPEVLKFVNVVDQVLTQMTMDLDRMVQDEVVKDAKNDDIVLATKIHANNMSEGAIELIQLFESADEFFGNAMRAAERDVSLNEGIVKNAAMKAKEMAIAAKKAERDFDQLVMTKVRKIREERRNRKHSEMVGEALAINHEIKRLLKSGAWYIINPAFGVIRWVVSVLYDKATDKRDREVLVRQLREEMEILEEKIQMAERNGDDKQRIELIRIRQKLVKEYERITKVRYTAKARLQKESMLT